MVMTINQQKTRTRFHRSVAWTLAGTVFLLIVLSYKQLSRPACDEWIGDYAARPGEEALLRIEREGDVYILITREVEGEVREPLDPMSADEFLDVQDNPIPIICALRGDGVKLVKLPSDSSINPTGSDIYPAATQYLMGVSVGFVGGVVGLYPVPNQAELKIFGGESQIE
jgi:hypothetical protein